jgi:hypothetical protein
MLKGDSARTVDEDPQHSRPSAAQQLDIDDFNALRATHALGDGRDFLDDGPFYGGQFLLHWALAATKKWAFAHSRCPTSSLLYTTRQAGRESSGARQGIFFPLNQFRGSFASAALRR